MNFYAFSGLINGIIGTTLGLFVFTRNKKDIRYVTHSLFCLTVSIWSYFYFVWQITPDKNMALICSRGLMAGAVFIPVCYLHHLCVFFDIYNKKKKIIFYGYLGGLFFLILNFTPLFVKDVSSKLIFKFWPNPGIAFHPFLILWFLYVLYGVFIVISEYRKSTGVRKNQLKYVLLATFIGWSGGATNFPLWYNIPILPFGNILVSGYMIILTYAIVKYRLMDITIVLTRAGIFAVVYTLILGLPFVVIKWLKPVLIPLLGENWWIAILVFGMALASAGPFIYLFIQRRAEAVLLKEQRRYQQALRELSKTLTRIRDLDKLLKAIVLNVIEQVKVHFAAVYLKDEEYKSYRLKHYFPLKSKSRFQEFIPLDDNLIKVLYEQKRPLPSEEIGPQGKISLDSGLVVPCFIAEGNLLGFLCLGHKPDNQMYTQDDLIVFETLSYSTSLAIENSQFWKEIEEHQRQARIQEMDLFSYSLAHEIDNPMNNIKTLARYLKDYLLKELNLPQEKQKEIEAVADSILSSQERVSGMVKAIEEFGKPTTGEFGPLELEDVLKNYLDLYLPEFKYHGIFFTKELPEKIPYIRGVKQELMQILANFSNNSIHALLATKEKKIHLKVEVPNQDWIRISFSDNGYGITEEKLRSIFAPFVTTKASTEGKGMGLYTIRRIVEKHKGKVWAESEGKGKGATFFVELPIAKDITEEDFKKEDRGKRLF